MLFVAGDFVCRCFDVIVFVVFWRLFRFLVLLLLFASFFFRCGFWFEILYMKMYITVEHKNFNTKTCVFIGVNARSAYMHASLSYTRQTDRQTDI